jgi:hypothetical protein
MVLVLVQDGRGVPLADDQDAVEEFATEAAGEAFGDRLGTRRLHRCLGGDDLAGHDGVRS